MADSGQSSQTAFLRIERTEAALRLSEATKTAILETALDCIITIDHKGFVLDWNPAAERTFGYSLAEAIGREMCELIVPLPLRDMHRRGLARAAETGADVLAGQRIEIPAVRRNGEEFPVELSITRVGAGPTPLFTGHIRDISNRKKAERELRESQQLLASLTQNITDAIFRRSTSGGLVFVNDAYVKMFGYDSADELREVQPERFYAQPARRPAVVALLEKDGMLRDHEIEYRRKDGTTFWGLTSVAGIRDEFGAILYFDGAIHDITERKQTEQRQAAQYAIVRTLADSGSLADAAAKILEAVCESLCWDMGSIWQTDPDGKTLHCVETWHRPGLGIRHFKEATREVRMTRGVGLPGRILETAEPAWISDVTEDENFPRGTIAVECGLHGAFGFPISLGSRVLGVIEFFSHEIREPDARLLQMFAAIGSQIGQFIERKRAERELQAEAELRRALEQEKELSRLKSNFVNVVSHEFRTPLGVIMSAAEILESYFDRLRPEQRVGHLQDIKFATTQMARLMEEVLLLGRVEAGKMQCKPESLDLAAFCDRLVEEQLSATSCKCPIVFEMAPFNGDARGDQAVMRHIFSNLLSNAVKYSPEKSRVLFSMRREGDEAVFEIRDNGIGIPLEDQGRLYEAFHRARNVGEIPGTGLGLVIVRRCTDLHDGTIEFTSEPGRGTVFSVRLKLFAGNSARTKRRRNPQPPTTDSLLQTRKASTRGSRPSKLKNAGVNPARRNAPKRSARTIRKARKP